MLKNSIKLLSTTSQRLVLLNPATASFSATPRLTTALNKPLLADTVDTATTSIESKREGDLTAADIMFSGAKESSQKAEKIGRAMAYYLEKVAERGKITYSFID
jgi:hypothetical protein